MNVTRRALWLDLEDTVITPVVDGWINSSIINVRKVKHFIDEFRPHSVNIFSFAIWNQHELGQFNKFCRPFLEKLLGTQFYFVPTVDDDILPVCTKVMNLGNGSVTFSDMSEFWGKHESFRLYMRHMYASGSTPVEVAFLDDAVYNESFSWKDLKVQGQIINIDTMKEPDGFSKSQTGTLSGSN
jgi:hypothetical protein